MKKLLMIVVVAVLSSLGLSCGGDDKPEVKSLVLSADATSIEIGETVSFSVTDGNGLVSDALITSNDGVVVTGGKFTPMQIGEFLFTAKKEGFNDSSVVKIEVTPSKENKLLLFLVTPESEISIGSSLSFKAVNGLGKAVADVELFFSLNGDDVFQPVDDVGSDINGEIFIDFIPMAGKYVFKIKKDGIESKEITVVVSEFNVVGNFNFKNKNYVIDRSTLVSLGNFSVNEVDTVALWELHINSGKNIFLGIYFTTPIASEGPEKPNGTNEVPLGVNIGEEGVFYEETDKGVAANFVWENWNKNVVKGSYKVNVKDLGGSPLSIEFKGEMLFIDGVQEPYEELEEEASQAKFSKVKHNNIKETYLKKKN